MQEVVIAGVSGGIGKAIAEQLLADNRELRIWGLCRNPDAAEFPADVAARINLMPWDATVQDPGALAQSLQRRLPGDLAIDTFFYAAGILHGKDLFPEKRLDEVRPEALLHAYQVNAVGFAMLARALQPWLRHAGFKRVLAISAKVGSLSDNRMGGWYAYRASKAALNMLVRNLAIELPRRHRPLACVVVHPGTTRTDLSAPFAKSLAQLNVHTPADTAGNMIDVAAALAETDNGRFINWDGTDLPW